MSRLPGDTIAEKLMLNHRVEGECWRWTAAHNEKGYALISVDGKTRRAHRVSYATFVGPIPEGLEVDHQCRVRDCINPNHLKAMTHLENLRRSMPSMGGLRVEVTECRHGHEFTPENTRIQRRPFGDTRVCRECTRRRGSAPVSCPDCGLEVLTKNLKRHRDHEHGEATS